MVYHNKFTGNAPKVISEGLNLKKFLGDHAPQKIHCKLLNGSSDANVYVHRLNCERMCLASSKQL